MILKIFHHPWIESALVQGPVHAPQPLIALNRSNRKWHMSHSKARMPKSLYIQWRSPRPPGKKHEQFLTGLIQALRMKTSDPGCFGRGIHHIIKPVYQRPQSSFTANHFIEGQFKICHTRIVIYTLTLKKLLRFRIGFIIES